MKVGDLVKFKNNGMIGLLYEMRSYKTREVYIKFRKYYTPAEDETLWAVLWSDDTKSNRWQGELRGISESR